MTTGMLVDPRYPWLDEPVDDPDQPNSPLEDPADDRDEYGSRQPSTKMQVWSTVPGIWWLTCGLCQWRGDRVSSWDFDSQPHAMEGAAWHAAGHDRRGDLPGSPFRWLGAVVA